MTLVHGSCWRRYCRPAVCKPLALLCPVLRLVRYDIQHGLMQELFALRYLAHPACVTSLTRLAARPVGMTSRARSLHV